MTADTGNHSEDEKLYRARERARMGDDDCPRPELSLAPDVDPTPATAKCDPEETAPVAEFLPPNPPPPAEDLPDLLPDPLNVFSQEAEATCVDVGDPDRVLISGTYNDVPGQRFFVAAGAETQSVFIDSIEEIPLSELYRIATYVGELQTYVDTNFLPAYIAVDFATFDQGLSDIPGIPLVIGTRIREELVIAQAEADAIAQTYVDSNIVCGYLNKPLWVTCLSVAPGYTIHYTDPMVDEQAFIAGGLFTSLISQADADSQAARSAAFDLECLVPNEEQDVTCSDAGLIDETQLVRWPTGWTFSAPPTVMDPLPTRTLEHQGIPTWTVDDWDTATNYTEKIPLSQLNGQEFLQLSQIGSGERRTLRTRVIIPAGDPRAAAIDQATANALAFNLAVAELDCFVPSRPRVTSCISPTYGSAEVRQRHLALGRSDVDSARDLTFAELDGGGHAGYGGPEYDRVNAGVVSYGSPSESTDSRIAFEVWMWPGFFDADTASNAESLSGAYAAGYLQCLWISYQHDCQCVSTQEDTDQTYAADPADLSSKFSEDVVAVEGVILDEARSAHTNRLTRGLILSASYPNAGEDIGYNNPTLDWPNLPQICQSGLSCLFVACKVACCEPKPDTRPYLTNGLPNYATWNGNWLSGPATKDDQDDFMDAWYAALAEKVFETCDLGEPIVFDPEDYDSCDVAGNGLDTITHAGPVDYGTPARFKRGGLLPWGSTWAEPGNVDVLPPGGGEPGLLLPGTVKACHVDPGDGVLPPDPWGFFSCAEGVAEGYQPEGLGAQARSLAIGRLDCTHIDWPRHLSNCREPNQKPFGPVVSLNLVNEAGSTQAANETSEGILMPLLECHDTHNFLATFSSAGGGGGGGGGGKMQLPAPSVANVGGKDTCIPPGLQDAVDFMFEDDCETPADGKDIPAEESSHVFIEVTCCPDAIKKSLLLHVIPDLDIDDEIKDALGTAKQLGRLGIPSGWAVLNGLQMSKPDSQFWYIASFGVWSLTGIGGKASVDAERISVQVHTGPILLDQTCCGSSSSSSSSSGSSGGSSSGSSGGSSSGSGSGSGSGSSSGSDKSTAIVPMPWHEKEFGALFTMESNEVLFEFIIWNIKLSGKRTVMTIDPRFLFVCELNSLSVVGAPNTDKPAYSCARVVGDKLIIDVEPSVSVSRPTWWKFWDRGAVVHSVMPARAALKLTGIRRGFLGVDMPQRSVNQFLANEEFLNSAYPAE